MTCLPSTDKYLWDIFDVPAAVIGIEMSSVRRMHKPKRVASILTVVKRVCATVFTMVKLSVDLDRVQEKTE